MGHSYIDKNLEIIKQRAAAAAKSSGREADDITLLAAIKSADDGEIHHLRELGIRTVGENRVQQLIERYDKLAADGFDIHFIGSLQTNKVKYIIDKVSLIHSLDSERLAAEIQKQAQKRCITANVLVEINSGAEQNKSGILHSEAADFCLSLERYPNIKLCGFMTLAPRCERRDDYYVFFNKTRETALSVWRDTLKREDEPIISMGMSESFEEAIGCGATIVRVGRGLFAK